MAFVAYLVSCAAFSIAATLAEWLFDPQVGNDSIPFLIDGGAANALVMIPFVVVFAVAGFLPARLILKWLGARSILAFMIAGALAPYIYPLMMILGDLLSGRLLFLTQVPSPTAFMIGCIPGAIAGAAYYVVRFGFSGPPKPGQVHG